MSDLSDGEREEDSPKSAQDSEHSDLMRNLITYKASQNPPINPETPPLTSYTSEHSQNTDNTSQSSQTATKSQDKLNPIDENAPLVTKQHKDGRCCTDNIDKADT